jgi:hypothetical protein
MEASKRVEYVKQIHLKTKQEIEKKSEYYAAKANKNRKKMIFEAGDFCVGASLEGQRNDIPSYFPVEMGHSRSLKG